MYGGGGDDEYYNEGYGYGEELHDGGEQGMQEEEVYDAVGPPPEGMWVEHSTLAYSNRAVTVLEYDSNLEALWAGYDDGRVSAFAMTRTSVAGADGAEDYDALQPERYSSFVSSEDGVASPIVQLVPLASCVASVSRTSIRMHTLGGLTLVRLGTVPQPTEAAATTTPTEVTFTCATALRPSQALLTAGNVGPTHIVAGTSASVAYAYDLEAYAGEPLLEYDVGSAATCVRASDTHLAVAGMDGKVRLLDSRLRSKAVQHTLDAHSGPIKDLCLQPDGFTMLTCGVIGRPVNPYDPKSPVNYVPDPLVKVFDLRMRRQLTPLSMSTSSPALIRFVPAAQHLQDAGIGEAAVLLASASGVVQLTPLSGDPSAIQVLYAPLQERKEQVTAAAVARAGNFLCVGTSAGTLAQYAVALPAEVRPKVNATAVPLVVPPSAPTPPVSVSPRALVLAGTYVIRPRAMDPTGALSALSLASSYHSTPAVRNRRLRLTSSRRISDEIIKMTHQQDFIGTVPNPGFSGNSMLYGAGSKRAYAVCDPRKRLEEHAQQAAAAAAAASAVSASASGGGAADMGRTGPRAATSELASPSPLAAGAAATAVGGSAVAPAGSGYASTIPASVRKIHSHRGKQRIKDFNYEALNATPFVAFENNAPNAYTNPVLQVMFALPEVRDCALAAQAAMYHHNNPTTLWCELGFLFHMMISVQKRSREQEILASEGEGGGGGGGKRLQRVVTPSNFQRTFQQIPESAALGLLDNRASAPPAGVGATSPVAAAADAAAGVSTLGGVQGAVGGLADPMATAAAKALAPVVPMGGEKDAQQLTQTFCRFLLQQLHREADLAVLAKNRASYSAASVLAAKDGAARHPPLPPLKNTIDSVFSFTIATTTTFLQSGTIELGSANKAYLLEIVYPILGKIVNPKSKTALAQAAAAVTPPAVLGRIESSKGAAPTSAPASEEPAAVAADVAADAVAAPTPTTDEVSANSAQAPEEQKVSKEKIEAAQDAPQPVPEPLPEHPAQQHSLIAAPAPGAVPSFASVLWGSFQRETHMRGWCSASETYEPFKQVRSLLTLPNLLTMLCGDTVRDPRDATLSGALGESQSYGNMHSNFWSQKVDFRHLLARAGSAAEGATATATAAPWLPFEIEVAAYRAPGSSTGSIYRASAAHQRTQAAAGRVGKSDRDRLVISCRLLPTAGATATLDPAAPEAVQLWTIFDGATEALALLPASALPEYGIDAPVNDKSVVAPLSAPGSAAAVKVGWDISRFSLMAAVSHVMKRPAPTAAATNAAAAAATAAAAADKTKAAAAAAALASAPPSDLQAALTMSKALTVSAAAPHAPPAVEGPRHSILHVRRLPSSSAGDEACEERKAGRNAEGGGGHDREQCEWWMFNDFVLQPSDLASAVTFADWRHPSCLFFVRDGYREGYEAFKADIAAVTAAMDGRERSAAAIAMTYPTDDKVPAFVLLLPSLSKTQCVRLVTSTGASGAATHHRHSGEEHHLPALPGAGSLVAFDGEFVSVQAERVELNAEGQKVVREEGRQLLARISLIEGGDAGDAGDATSSSSSFRLLADDYILPAEPVIDYVTRFSGLTEDDLNPAASRHAVVPYRTAYLKLRYFIDSGCVFVGHGLQKDFETANIFVPPDQVRDTVELWRLPNQRKISLRFLASYLLKADIQGEVHDSIEDAKTALLLYRHYEQTKAKGAEHLHVALQDLYAYGMRTNWTIGLDTVPRSS